MATATDTRQRRQQKANVKNVSKNEKREEEDFQMPEITLIYGHFQWI